MGKLRKPCETSGLVALVLALVTGTFCNVASSAELLPKKNWRLVSASSQELRGTEYVATNAFDGSAWTIWHTEWDESAGPLPHHITIDLGANYTINEFRYLPRQGSYVNGQIAKFRLQLSSDGSQWTTVAEGALPTGKTEKRVTFSPKAGRYAKLIALSEINGNQWTTAAEIGFVGSSGVSTGGVVTSPTPDDSSNESPSTPTEPTSPISHDDPIDWKQLIAQADGVIRVVSTAAQFNSAAAAARPGDVILLKDGVYTGVKLNIESNGTATQPIVYTAQNPGRVIFRGLGRRAIYIGGDHNIVGGFRFEDSQAYIVYLERASNNRITDSVFVRCGIDIFDRIITIYNGSNDNRFDHLRMEDITSIGIGVHLPRPGLESFMTSLRTRIDHNVFANIRRSESGGGREPIQIGAQTGSDGVSVSDSYTVVEYNEFRDINGQAVNSKSNKETFRYNRFINVRWEGLSLRVGNSKTVDGNYFENVGRPIHAYGTDHVITNNLIKNAEIGILIPRWGDYEVRSGKMSGSPPTGRMLIAHNTIAGVTASAVELGRVWGFVGEGLKVAENVPFENRFVNNIFASGAGRLFKMYGDRGSDVYNNLYFAYGAADVGYAGRTPISGNPLLSSTLRPDASSIAVGRAVSLTNVKQDVVRTPRPQGAAPDLGAYER